MCSSNSKTKTDGSDHRQAQIKALAGTHIAARERVTARLLLGKWEKNPVITFSVQETR
jgi:hypothetical protein